MGELARPVMSLVELLAAVLVQMQTALGALIAQSNTGQMEPNAIHAMFLAELTALLALITIAQDPPFAPWTITTVLPLLACLAMFLAMMRLAVLRRATQAVFPVPPIITTMERLSVFSAMCLVLPLAQILEPTQTVPQDVQQVITTLALSAILATFRVEPLVVGGLAVTALGFLNAQPVIGTMDHATLVMWLATLFAMEALLVIVREFLHALLDGGITLAHVMHAMSPVQAALLRETQIA